MTPPADARAAEEAFEAALAGRPATADARALTAFTDAVRAGATAPGRPNAALAELLATGLLTDPSRTTVGRPARTSRKRPRMILSTLVAKFAAAGAVAKATTAGGAVALALTGAVTTDVLPLTEDQGVVESGDTADTAPEPTDGTVVADPGTGDEGVPVEEDGEALEEEQAGDETGEEAAGDTPGPAGPGVPLSYED